MFNFALSLNRFIEPDLPKLSKPLANSIAQSMKLGKAPLTGAPLSKKPKTITQKSAALDLSPFAEMSPNFMVITSDDGDILSINQATLNALDLEAHQKDSLNFLKIFHPEDRPYIRNTVQTMIMESKETGAPNSLDFEARLNTQNGQTITAKWQMRAEQGKTYCLGENITQDSAQKEEIQLRKNQLVQAESIGRFGRWQWTIGHDQFDWSDEVYRIFGCDIDGFMPSMDNIYAMLHEDDKDRMDQTLQRAVINQNAFDMDFCIQRPDGQQRFIRCEGRCTTDEDGDVVALYGIMQDMSERIIYERDLRAAKEAAEKACAARTQFLANMSHELRTPLNAIIGFSEMIEGQYLGEVGNDKYIEYGKNIRESGAHLLDLIGDILDMAKIEAGKYDLDLEDISLNAIIDNALTMIKPRADEKKIAVHYDAPIREDLMMQLDRRACLQIMLNILSNAVKFTPENGDITLNCTEHKNSITLNISDNGIGIPANKLASITNPFEQVVSHYTRDHEGSGLGLAITKELVELHGGSLKIKSQIDAGTDVIITLPLRP